MTKSSLETWLAMPLIGIMKLWPLLIPLLAFAPSAFAKDGLRGEEFCFPAKDVPKLIDSLAKIDQDRRNVVNVTPDPKFLIKDGGAWPEAFYLKQDDQMITQMPVKIEDDGRVPNFLSAVRANPNSDICVLDPSRADRSEYDEGLYFEMGLSPLFLSASGRHQIADLEEGVKDGKKFYKKMIPSAVRLLMPDSDHLAVRYDDFRKEGAALFADVGGTLIALDTEIYKDMHIVAYDDLEDMGASALVVQGGAYQLQPTFSVKTLKRFGWGEEDE